MRIPLRIIVLSLLLTLSINILYCQTEDDWSQMYQSAQLKGKLDARGDDIFFLGGFAFGLIGIIGSEFYHPEPDPETMSRMIQENGAEYALFYKTAYVNEAKNRNRKYATDGWIMRTILLLPAYCVYRANN